MQQRHTQAATQPEHPSLHTITMCSVLTCWVANVTKQKFFLLFRALSLGK